MQNSTSEESVEQTMATALASLSEPEIFSPREEEADPPSIVADSSVAGTEQASPPELLQSVNEEHQEIFMGTAPEQDSSPFAFPFQVSGGLSLTGLPTQKESQIELPLEKSTQTEAPSAPSLRRRRWLLISGVVLTTILLGSLFVFAQSATPTTPPLTSTTSVQTPPPAGGKTISPVPTKAVPPTVQQTPPPAASSMRSFVDTFHRVNQNGWGTASGGQKWQVAEANNQQAFSIEAQVGQIAANAPTATYYTALLGPALPMQDVEVSTTFLMQRFTAQSNMGLVLRYKDSTTYYKAYVDGTSLVLMKNVNGRQTTLKQIRFSASADTSYVLRFKADQNLLMAKVWRQAQREPGWMISTTDDALQMGQVGVRARLLPATQVHVLTFQAHV